MHRHGPLANQEHGNDQDHDHADIDPDIHEIPIKLFVCDFGKVRQFRAGGQHAPGARNDADRKVGFQFQNFGLQKSYDGPKQFQENYDQQEIVQQFEAGYNSDPLLNATTMKTYQLCAKISIPRMSKLKPAVM